MRKYKIAVLPGDGIGIDVTREAIKVLRAVATVDEEITFDFERNIRTPDLGGCSTTWEVGDDLEQRIRMMAK